VTARLYSGTLRHARYTQKQHAFSYKVFMPFVELETLDELTEQRCHCGQLALGTGTVSQARLFGRP
jgi:DUF1365 family protein